MNKVHRRTTDSIPVDLGKLARYERMAWAERKQALEQLDQLYPLAR